MVGEPGEGEVQVDRRRLRRVLALPRGPARPVQLLGAEAQQGALLFRALGVRDVLEEPAHAERYGFLRQGRGEPYEAAAPAPAGLFGLVGPERHPQFGGGRRSAFGEDVRQGALQLLHALDQQIAQRAPEHGRTAHAQGAGGVRVDDRGPQIGVDQHHGPGGVHEERLAQRDGPFQVDLGVHLAERAVHAGRPAVGPEHRGGLGADQDAAPVLGQQRELVDLAAGRAGRRQQAGLHLVGVLLADRPARQPLAADRLVRRPAEDAFRLAVPVRDRAVGAEGAQRGVHPVQQGGEQA